MNVSHVNEIIAHTLQEFAYAKKKNTFCIKQHFDALDFTPVVDVSFIKKINVNLKK